MNSSFESKSIIVFGLGESKIGEDSRSMSEMPVVNSTYPEENRFGLVWFLCLMAYQPLWVI